MARLCCGAFLQLADGKAENLSYVPREHLRPQYIRKLIDARQDLGTKPLDCRRCEGSREHMANLRWRRKLAYSPSAYLLPDGGSFAQPLGVRAPRRRYMKWEKWNSNL